MGIITAWMGATLGGSTSPLSSPCTMIRAPMSLHDTPHEVCHANVSTFCVSRNLTSNGFAKFCLENGRCPSARPSVRHYGFHGSGINCPHEFLLLALFSYYYRNCKLFLHRFSVNVEYCHYLNFCLLLCCMDSVALLPQEF